MSERQMRRARARELERASRRGGETASTSGRAKKATVAAGAALGATVLFAPAAQAANFEVNSLDDPGDGTCDATECTLREAVEAANATAGADTVTFASGLSGSIELDAGEIPITEAVQIQGPGADVITVDANYNSRIFYVSTADTDAVSISGLTLREGSAGYADGSIGGAVYVEGGSGPVSFIDSVLRNSYARYDGGAIGALYGAGLTLTNTAVRGSAARYVGGGVFAQGTETTLSGATISGNEVFRGAGGGIYLDGAALTADSSRVVSNHAKYRGGGVYVGDTGTEEVRQVTDGVTFRDSEIAHNLTKYAGAGVFLDSIDGPSSFERTTITDNAALSDGGGIYLYETEYDGSLTISGSTFTGNTAGDDGGGAYLYRPSDPIVIEETTFDGNAAHDDGAGVYLYDTEGDGTLTVSRSTFSHNESESDGGGLRLGADNLITIENSTLSGNSAAEEGGGINVDLLYTGGEEAASGELQVNNSTISGNSAYGGAGEESNTGAGGGVYVGDFDGDVGISSSILANSGAGHDLAQELYVGEGEGPDGDLTIGFSLIEDPGGTTFTTDPAGSNIIGQDPQLAELDDNGGLTETHMPAFTSPVIDAGVSNGLEIDQRGLARTVDQPNVANRAGSDATDMGSVELQAQAFPAGPEAANCQGQEGTRIEGTEGDDNLNGTSDADTILGLGGSDLIKGLVGPDCIDGGSGRDRIKGGGGNDLVLGGGDVDKLKGQGGKDRLKGGAGKDHLVGDEGRDRLNGGRGVDRMRGGAAKDRYRGGRGNDKINSVDNKRDRVNCGAGDDRAVVDELDRVGASCEAVVKLPSKNGDD